MVNIRDMLNEVENTINCYERGADMLDRCTLIGTNQYKMNAPFGGYYCVVCGHMINVDNRCQRDKPEDHDPTCIIGRILEVQQFFTDVRLGNISLLEDEKD